jgi:hypothetical protein
MFDSPLLELTDVRRASNGLLAVTLQESPFAFEETDPFFSDEAWTFDDEILNAADSWAFPADWAFAAADRGCSGCGCTCGGCGCGCRDGAAANAGPMNADPVNAGVRWVCYLDPATLEVQLVEAEEVSPDGSMRESSRYLLVGREGAARPDPVQAAWLYAQMVRWGQTTLTPDQAWKLVTYIRSLRTANEPQAPPAD